MKKKTRIKKNTFLLLSLVYVFCAEYMYCTYLLHVPFIELSLALNSEGFFVSLASFAVQRKEKFYTVKLKT